MEKIMEKSSNGMISDINDLVKLFCDYGFNLKMYSFPDIAFSMEQRFKGIKDVLSRENPAFRFIWHNNKEITFTIFENHSIHHKGITYQEEGKKFYFFSVQNNISELIYRDDEMYQLYKDCSKEIMKFFAKEELREISLNLLGV